MCIKKICLLICLAMHFPMSAQKLTVDGMKSTNDLSASQYRRKDLAGEACALVKVQLAITGATFEGNVIQPVEYKSGEYWVYMSKGSYELHIKLQNFLPLEVNFRDYGIRGVEPLMTYKLVVPMPQVSQGRKMNKQERMEVENKKVVKAEDSPIETYTVNGVSFNMIRIEGGSFMMGATSEMLEGAKSDEEPVHHVTLSDYCIGETEVTQELWKAVMGKNPSKYKSKNKPVEMISWHDCQEFIRKLNALTGRKFRLPTEAEWEYAARGGKLSRGTKYSGSDFISVVSWSNDYPTIPSRTADVRNKVGNELGLYDMTGNVWEWCQDIYGPYNGATADNPKGETTGTARVFRGGGWSNSEKFCRISVRNFDDPYKTSYDLGLRLAL